MIPNFLNMDEVTGGADGEKVPLLLLLLLLPLPGFEAGLLLRKKMKATKTITRRTWTKTSMIERRRRWRKIMERMMSRLPWNRETPLSIRLFWKHGHPR